MTERDHFTTDQTMILEPGPTRGTGRLEAGFRPYRPTRRDTFFNGAIGATILAILVAVGLLVTQLATSSDVIALKAPHHHSALPPHRLDTSGRVVKSQTLQPLNTTSQSAPAPQQSAPPAQQSAPPAQQSAPPVSPPCNGATLLALIQTTTTAQGITGDSDVVCSGNYAAAQFYGDPVSVQGFQALFQWNGTAWTVLTYGTAIPCAAYGLPADLLSQLSCPGS
jgi:hypothetical protein